MNDSAFGNPLLQPAKFPKRSLQLTTPVTQSTAARPRTILLLISAIIAILAHAIFLLLLPAAWRKNQSPDYAVYYEPVASQLVAGGGLFLASKPALRYPPGIPMLYAATFLTSDRLGISRGIGLRILEGVFVIATGLLVAAVAMRFFSWRIALAASILWSTYPFHLWLTKQPDASTAFSMLLLLCTFLFLIWSADGCHAVS